MIHWPCYFSFVPMAKKSQSTPAHSEVELADAVNRLAENVNALTDIITQVRSEIDWIINNRAEFRSENSAATNEHEHVSCSECDAGTESLAGALKTGWSELTEHDGTYLGLCPKCLDEHCSVMPKPVLPIRAMETDGEDLPDEDSAEPDRPKDTLF